MVPLLRENLPSSSEPIWFAEGEHENEVLTDVHLELHTRCDPHGHTTNMSADGCT